MERFKEKFWCYLPSPSLQLRSWRSEKRRHPTSGLWNQKTVLDYTKGRHGADLSDQLSANYTCLRRSTKWYQKVAYELIFGTSIVNSYLIHKENYAMDDIIILQFRESVVRSWHLGVSTENTKPGPKQQSTGHCKRKLVDHTLGQIEGYGRYVRRPCTGCYEKEGNNDQEKRAMGQQGKRKLFVLSVVNGFVLNVLTRSIMLWNKIFNLLPKTKRKRYCSL